MTKSTSVSHLESLQWAITEEALRNVLAQAKENIEAFFDVGDAAKTPFRRDGNKAILDISGVLFKRSNILTLIGIGSSLENLSSQLTKAVDDADVKEIELHIDSPGGEVNGTNQFADQVYAARGKKPIKAIVKGAAASAAYWIASAADTIEATDETNMIGSVGVIMTVQPRGADERIFISSNAKRKNPDPDTDTGKDVYTGIVNRLEDVFIEKLARNRNVSTSFVKNNFGKGDILLAKEALKAKMIDSLNGGNMEITAKILKDEYKAVHDEIVSAAVTPLTAELEDLKTKLQAATEETETLKAKLMPKAPDMPPEIAAKIDALEKDVLASKLAGVLDEPRKDLVALHGKLAIDEITKIGSHFVALQKKIDELGKQKSVAEGDTTVEAQINAEIESLVASGMSRTDAITAAHKKFVK